LYKKEFLGLVFGFYSLLLTMHSNNEIRNIL